VPVTLREVEDELEVEARATVDQRLLDMTFSPLRSVRPRAHLLVAGRLMRDW